MYPLNPDEYVEFCERLIENADKYGHEEHHLFEQVLDELIETITDRLK